MCAQRSPYKWGAACDSEYIRKHVSRMPACGDSDDISMVARPRSRIQWVGANSWCFADDNRVRMFSCPCSTTIMLVHRPHIIVSANIRCTWFGIIDVIRDIPRHIDAANLPSMAFVEVVSSTMTRRERAVHVHGRNRRRNLVSLVYNTTNWWYDCTGCIPMLPSIPYKNGVRRDWEYVVLVRTHNRTRTRTCTRAHVLITWDPLRRLSRRIRIGTHEHVHRSDNGTVMIGDTRHIVIRAGIVILLPAEQQPLPGT